MRLIFVHRKETDNLGDRMSSPALYLDFPSHQVERLELKGRASRNALVVIGGGGLFHPCFRRFLSAWIDHNEVVLWGVGSNTHDKLDDPYPEISRHDNVLLSGTRDFKGRDRNFYVPCASCLSPLFSEAVPDGSDPVVYEHKDHPIPLDLPKKNNDSRKNNLEEVVQFLAASGSVISNSYHGVYWSLLLGKRVALFRPFSTRFRSFPFVVPTCTRSDFLEVLSTAVPRPWFADDCRQRNRLFHEVVLRELDR